MKEIKGYAIVGAITAIIIYFLAPNIVGNRIEVVESIHHPNNYNNSNSYSDVFKKVNKSVVSIYTRKSTARKNIYFIDPRERALVKKKYSPTGQGSGVIFSSQGHIITNFHVIAGSEEILVKDYDGKEYGTVIVGIDPLTDLAVLKIDKNSSGITLGNIKNINIGDIALAIGNPLGVGQTITLGIISATDKEISPNAYSYQRYVQTDAAINPGNSGGPLFNMNGEVVGINTAIQSATGEFSGIGFAVPSNTVKKVVPVLIENGEFKHPWMGISGTDVDPELAEVRELKSSKGFLVVSVIEGSPAETAGLLGVTETEERDGREFALDGDIILSIDGETVRKISDILVHLQREKSVGDEMVLSVNRNGEMLELTMILEERPQ